MQIFTNQLMLTWITIRIDVLCDMIYICKNRVFVAVTRKPLR